ncbi:MAG: hypothetical protein ACD_75C01048G0001 [uncultured bacterium]|nr:MAG: hypothetical protein ACD_75C01048G0001 [uncultured bacterium]
MRFLVRFPQEAGLQFGPVVTLHRRIEFVGRDLKRGLAGQFIVYPGDDFLQQPVAGVGSHIKGRDADGAAEKNLPSFTLDGGTIGNVVMVDLAKDDVPAGERGDQILHIHRFGHVLPQVMKERIAAAFETGVPGGGKETLPVGQIHGHPRIEDAHLRQFFLEPLMVAEHAVQGRTGLS